MAAIAGCPFYTTNTIDMAFNGPEEYFSGEALDSGVYSFTVRAVYLLDAPDASIEDALRAKMRVRKNSVRFRFLGNGRYYPAAEVVIGDSPLIYRPLDDGLALSHDDWAEIAVAYRVLDSDLRQDYLSASVRINKRLVGEVTHVVHPVEPIFEPVPVE
ncbi:MAG TPA: hypothetical protein ENN80_12695 [Candidatus Hydrogenedentes bacterium]|nr:hypothetical protein [Candidatus Hydrogenedentota bacterium]